MVSSIFSANHIDNHPVNWFIFSVSAILRSLSIQMIVDRVYVGIKSPMSGINSSIFMTVETLLLVILKRRLVSSTSNISQAIGISKIGAAIV